MYCTACNEELSEIDTFEDIDEDMCMECINSSRDYADEEDALHTEEHISFSDLNDLGIDI